MSSNGTHPSYVIGTDEYSRQQRADRGFSTQDTFSFDTYIAGVIAGGVRELQRRGMGCPGSFMDSTGMTVEERTDRWRELLGEMAGGFEAYVEADAWGVEPPAMFPEAMGLFVQWFGALWD